MDISSNPDEHFLSGIRVLEVADEKGEYAGKVLAGLGADIIKVEPPRGEITRSYGPFHMDIEHPDRSLHFWHFNFGKRSLTLDLDVTQDQGTFRVLASQADVLIETRDPSYLRERGLDVHDLRASNPGLIVTRMSPFGDDGPWKSYLASDLVHLALGGIAMNCGYDPDPSGMYDTPPMAPQIWQSYQVAGEVMVLAILGALMFRERTGRGQCLEGSVHEAVSKITETDLPDWIYSRVEHHRQTCRHSMPTVGLPSIAATKDGRWILPYRSYTQTALGAGLEPTLQLLRRYGLHGDLDDPKYKEAEYVAQPHVALHIGALIDRFIGRTLWNREVWREAQAEGLAWAPERRPDENLEDKHWASRETFVDVFHDETSQVVKEVGAKWLCQEVPWRRSPRAPLLGEHNEQILREAASWNRPSEFGVQPLYAESDDDFALSGVRVIDLGWLLASAGAGRFLAAFGAEVIKIEHKSRPDGMRFNVGIVPEGGRVERDEADGPILTEPAGRLNRSGAFMDINAGKLSASLNIRTDQGREMLVDLIKRSDVLIEGFSPGTLERLGLSREVLAEVNPRLIYAQQSGMGSVGTYGRMRSYGPTAQAFAGLSEMSGLPEPYPPAGIGFSFLDWCGAYNLTIAVLSALFRRSRTGKGCWIDSSQVEAGTYMAGPTVLDFSVNGRPFRRFGNRSPYKLAAPHGIYPCRGDDRWIAVSCFTDSQWAGLAQTLGHTEWISDSSFNSLSLRLENQDDLDSLVGSASRGWDAYELMEALQASLVPSGVCQTAQDRCEQDPQLRHLQWLCELEQAEIGRWPALTFPVRLSDSPARVGGTHQRHGPSYGQDNEYVYGQILGLRPDEIKELENAMSSSFTNLTEVNSPKTVSNRYDMPVVFGQSVLPDVTEIASVRLTLVRFVTTRAAINSLIPPHFVLPEGEPSVTIAHSVYGGVDYLMGRGYNVLAVSTPVVHPKLERRAPYGFVLWESDATAVAAGREYMGHAKLYAEVSCATQAGEALRFSCSEFGATLVSGSVDHLEPLRGRQLDEFRKGNANSLSYGWKYIPGSGDVPDADYATMLTTHNVFNSAWRGHGEVTFHTPTTSEAPISSRIVQRLSSLPNRGWRSAFTAVGSMQVDRTATQRI